jgi:hypothetical protein
MTYVSNICSYSSSCTQYIVLVIILPWSTTTENLTLAYNTAGVSKINYGTFWLEAKSKYQYNVYGLG